EDVVDPLAHQRNRMKMAGAGPAAGNSYVDRFALYVRSFSPCLEFVIRISDDAADRGLNTLNKLSESASRISRQATHHLFRDGQRTLFPEVFRSKVPEEQSLD